MYLYKATIYKNPSEIAGLTQAQIDQHNTDRTDFETNFKATAIKVDEIIFAETTFVIILSYVAFKTKIISPITWADVKYTEDSIQYILHLVSSNPL